MKHKDYFDFLLETKEYYPGEIVELSLICREVSRGKGIEYLVIGIPNFSFIENIQEGFNHYCKFIMPNQDIEVRLADSI